MLTPPEIVDILKKLKLTTMANDFMEISEAPQYQELDFEERMGILLFNEMTVRNQRRMMRYLQRSGLKKVDPFFMAEIDKLIKNKERNLDERLLNRLLTCRWIENSSNVLITGPFMQDIRLCIHIGVLFFVNPATDSNAGSGNKRMNSVLVNRCLTICVVITGDVDVLRLNLRFSKPE